jgi:16S rRNA (guanine527-N7)-methyltransferase
VSAVEFANELDRVLPQDLPQRGSVVEGAARHLELIVEANQFLNLTRITDPRQAAIKHVFDSVMPWRLFQGARHVLDAGTGAGFPGIPLALVLPETRFTLAESIHKKARFVASVLADMGPPNARIEARRAEELECDGAIGIITGRALAPISRALTLFRPALKAGAKLFLYKGPDVGEEIAQAQSEIRRSRAKVEIVTHYELPDGMGRRAIVEIRL